MILYELNTIIYYIRDRIIIQAKKKKEIELSTLKLRTTIILQNFPVNDDQFIIFGSFYLSQSSAYNMELEIKDHGTSFLKIYKLHKMSYFFSENY